MSFLPGFLPGLGLVKGMATTLKRFFEPKATIRYPEVRAEGSPKFRGRLQLLYDEYGTLKCETCFQCAQACPIECIDMGGVDTRGRYHVHWGPPETYGERRDESALRRSGRTVPDQVYEHFGGIDLAPVDAILDEHDYDPKKLLPILEGVQEAYGYLPVGAIKHISFRTGAWYAFIYGAASYYRHLRFVGVRRRPTERAPLCRCPRVGTERAARRGPRRPRGRGTQGNDRARSRRLDQPARTRRPEGPLTG
jgi:hypothetical protein